MQLTTERIRLLYCRLHFYDETNESDMYVFIGDKVRMFTTNEQTVNWIA